MIVDQIVACMWDQRRCVVLWPSRPTAHRFVDRAPILRLKLAGSRGLASLGVGRHIGYFVAAVGFCAILNSYLTLTPSFRWTNQGPGKGCHSASGQSAGLGLLIAYKSEESQRPWLTSASGFYATLVTVKENFDRLEPA